MEVSTVDRRRIEGLQRLGYLLDNSIPIPGTKYRIGLDALIGLIPGVGDLAGGVLSLYIILQSARLGIPRALLGRMAWNVAFETVVGSVPILGDLFDAGYKANLRNLALVQQHMEDPRESRLASRRFALLVVGGLVLLIAAAVGLGVLLVQLLQRPVL